MSTTVKAGSLLTRTYANITGVDLTRIETSLTRSPKMINMWRDYEHGANIATRPAKGSEILTNYGNEKICDVSKYKVGSREMYLIHAGVKLYKCENYNISTLINSGLNPVRGKAFIFNNIWYFKDGINYKKYDGTTISDVVGYIPTTSISRKPEGGGTQLDPVNMLSDYRINTFVADGESTKYYLDTTGIDETDVVVKVNDVTVSTTEYNVNATDGYITFTTAPTKPLTDGEDNVSIQYKKHVTGHKERVLKCNLVTQFDDKIFISGNTDYPNTIFYSNELDPTYFPDTYYYNEGNDNAAVKAMVVGNNALWVFKESNQANETIFYHTPTTVLENNVTENKYPSTHSNISVGCLNGAINFKDKICFLSANGLECITGDIESEQVITHKSTLVDSELIYEDGYWEDGVKMAVYYGYLVIAVGKNMYLADSRVNATNIDHYEYEWFVWNFDEEITSLDCIDDELYVGFGSDLYELDNFMDDREVKSSFMTSYDSFGYDYYQKTTNKRGSVVEINGTDIKEYVYVDVDEINDDNRKLIGTFTTNKGSDSIKSNPYFVNRIKEKKFKNIAFEFESDKPMEFKSMTIQAYIGNYVKR